MHLVRVKLEFFLHFLLFLFLRRLIQTAQEQKILYSVLAALIVALILHNPHFPQRHIN